MKKIINKLKFYIVIIILLILTISKYKILAYPMDSYPQSYTVTSYPSDSNSINFLTYSNNRIVVKYPKELESNDWQPTSDILWSTSFLPKNKSTSEFFEISIGELIYDRSTFKDWLLSHINNPNMNEHNIKFVKFPEEDLINLPFKKNNAVFFKEQYFSTIIYRIVIEKSDRIYSIALAAPKLNSHTINTFLDFIKNFDFNDQKLEIEKKTENIINEKLKNDSVIIKPNTSSTVQLQALTTLTTSYKLPWPNKLAYTVTQGWNGSTSHYGVAQYAYDFGIGEGQQVSASSSGTVSKVINSYSDCGGELYKDYANYVVINHPDGTATLYLHLKTVNVSVGKTVTQGDIIGQAGKVGYTFCGPHLHFQREIQANSYWTQSQTIYFDEYPGQQLSVGSYYTSQNYSGCNGNNPVFSNWNVSNSLTCDPIGSLTIKTESTLHVTGSDIIRITVH